MFLFKTKSCMFLVVLLTSILSLSLRAGAADPSYSVSVGGGSFSPNPITGSMTAKATLTGTLNVQNPNQEIQESGDNWSWSASVTGYKATSQAAFGPVPSGIALPVVSASSGSATSTVTATASQTTSPVTFPGYYQVTVSATDSFTLTDSSTKPAMVTSQSKTGSTTLNITVAVLDISLAGTGTVTDTTQSAVIGQQINLQASITPSDLTQLSNSSGSWTIPGFAILGESFTDEQGTYTPLLDHSGYQKIFYWVDGSSNRSVIYNLNINGATLTAQCAFNVKSPQNVKVSYTLGVPGIDTNYGYETNGSVWAHDGKFPQSTNDTVGLGILWSVDFSQSTSSRGYYSWIQTISSEVRTVQRENGTSYTIEGQTFPSLDGRFLQPLIGPDSNRYFDSPAGLYSPFQSDNFGPFNDMKNITASNQFRDWLMYQPDIPNSINVPLGTCAWEWHAQATNGKTNAQGVFTFTTVSLSNSSPSPTAFTTNIGPSSYPIWSSNDKNDSHLVQH